MKKSILVLALCALGLTSLAQQKDTLRINVNGNEIIILTDDVNSLSQTDYNAIIKRLTDETQRIVSAQNQEMATINKQEKNGNITAAEAAKQREEVAERTSAELEALSDEIEHWADRYGEAMEENAENPEQWTEQWESNAKKYESVNPPTPPTPPTPNETDPSENDGAIIVVDENGVRFEKGSDDWDPEKAKEVKEKYKKNQTIGYFDWHFGWNNWVNADGMATSQPPVGNVPNQTAELNFWPSMVWGFGFGGKSRMGTSKMYIRYGAQFNWHYFQLKGNTIAVKSQIPPIGFDGVSFVQDMTKNYSKSSFRIIYLDAPVMFEFDNSKPGRSNGFSFALGGYGGLRLGAKTLVKYSDFNGDNSKVKDENNYYTNGFRYGALAQIGFGTFKITAKYDLNNLFRTDRTTPDYQIASLTLGWVFP